MSEPRTDPPNDDREWRQLTSAWHAEAGPAPAPPSNAALRAKVRRQGWRLVALAVSEVVFAVAMMAFLVRISLAEREPSLTVATVFVAFFFVVTFAFTVRNRRGLWRADAESTVAHAELVRRRCLGRLRTVRFSFALLAAQALFLAAWMPWRILSTPRLAERGLEPYLVGFGVLVAVVVVYSVVLSWMGRRSRRELAEVETLLDQLEGRASP